MRNRIGSSLGIALALVAVLAAGAAAQERRARAVDNPLLRAKTFTLAGRCSGALTGQVVVDGVTYRLSPDARLYEIGRGVVPGGTFYFDRVVSVTGLEIRGTLVITGVTIRPETIPGVSGAVGLKDEGRSPR